MIYHWTHKNNLQNILKNGLQKRAHGKWGGTPTGDGIYVLDHAEPPSAILDGMGLSDDDTILVAIDASMSDTLMDEDDIALISEAEPQIAFAEKYPEIAQEFSQLAANITDNNQLQQLKIDIVNKYKLRADPDLADYGQGGSGWTGRYPSDIPPNKIKAIYGLNEEGGLTQIWPDPQIAQIADKIE